jgi:hypothetical protein
MVATPSASDFKARYPEFTGVADSLVTSVIAEASPMVSGEWHEPDQKPAIMAFTAHLLSMEGYPARALLPAGAPLPASAGREIVMRKVGDVTTQYAQASSGAEGASSGLLGSLTLTVYGRRFAQLLKLNAPAIGLV